MTTATKIPKLYIDGIDFDADRIRHARDHLIELRDMALKWGGMDDAIQLSFTIALLGHLADWTQD